jgi:hypothetical protein
MHGVKNAMIQLHIIAKNKLKLILFNIKVVNVLYVDMINILVHWIFITLILSRKISQYLILEHIRLTKLKKNLTNVFVFVETATPNYMLDLYH